MNIETNHTDTRLIQDFLDNAGSSLETFRYFDTRTLDCTENHLITLVITINDTPVGYGHLDPEGDKVWLGVCVAEEYIGQGWGVTILEMLLLYAENSNISTVWLSVDVHNTKAIKLYESLGFQKYKQVAQTFFMRIDLT